jgi:hypothetical protein
VEFCAFASTLTVVLCLPLAQKSPSGIKELFGYFLAVQKVSGRKKA